MEETFERKNLGTSKSGTTVGLIPPVPNMSAQDLKNRLKVPTMQATSTKLLKSSTTTSLMQSQSLSSLHKIPPSAGELKVKNILENGYLKDVHRERTLNPTLSNAGSAAELANYPKTHSSKTFGFSNTNNTLTNTIQEISMNQSFITMKIVHKTFLSSLSLTAAQHQELFHVANTFYYLRLNTTNNLTAPDTVYNLEVIKQDQVDKKLYFTISKEGITMFRDKQSQFTNLAQWEREYTLYHKISLIKFFKLYKRWKVS